MKTRRLPQFQRLVRCSLSFVRTSHSQPQAHIHISPAPGHIRSQSRPYSSRSPVPLPLSSSTSIRVPLQARCTHLVRDYREYKDPSGHDAQSNGSTSELRRAADEERAVLLSTFGSLTTRRDSNSWAAMFASDSDSQQRAGVNLGNLYAAQELLHTAVVKIRCPQVLATSELSGIALTLSQLARLGMLSVIMIDCDETEAQEGSNVYSPEWMRGIRHECDRVAGAIMNHHRKGTQIAEMLNVSPSQQAFLSPGLHPSGGVEVRSRELMALLRRGSIPIIPPFAFTPAATIQRIQPDDGALALARDLAGLSPYSLGRARNISLDRVIVLDPLGGLPTVEDPEHSSHVFVNLEQDYLKVRRHLSQAPTPGTRNRHMKNLDLVQRCLAVLPPTSSALLTTPYEAIGKTYAVTGQERMTELGVSTRPKRNILIHSLLTDKPLVSSSLPTTRLSSSSGSSITTTNSHRTPATFFKRGVPLTIIPDPSVTPWVAPGPDSVPLDLRSDPRIDFPRLLHLIEDSFGRKLDVKDYLTRIHGKLAGIIVAGEYEGGAILTWEAPPATLKSEIARPLVPYLDKFAVLRKSQGSGGVSDVVFNAMVRDCFPGGVVWRSRQNNPVNKWYFERSVGTWKIPDSNWTMFWTGGDIDWSDGPSAISNIPASDDKAKRWEDIVGVCASIQASWADSKAPD